jgi:hypothetical protein
VEKMISTSQATLLEIQGNDADVTGNDFRD